jgi:membrane associated rhomboid family serine protease
MYQNSYGPIDRFCAKHPRFGVPNLMLYLIIGQLAVFLVDLFTSNMASSLLFFSRAAIVYGQVWRLVTFVFLPNASNPFYLLLGCYFYYWIGTMLEREWGTAKFTLFYLSGVVLSIISGMILGYASIYYINLSIFLIIATLYGEMQVLLFFIIPVKMKWMAFIDVALILVSVIGDLMDGDWVGALMPLASFVNYFIFTWPFWAYKLGFARRRADPKVINFKKAQQQAKKQAQATGGYRHKCAVCGITDADDPNMEFRYCSKCDGYYCYCMDHINNHIHIHND